MPLDKMPAQQQARTQVEPTPRSYEVGRGSPPRETQFKPGRSGNPKGRPKNRTLKELFRKVADQSLDEGHAQYGNLDPKLSKIDGALVALFRQSRRGDARALKQVLELYREFSSDDDEGETEGVAELETAKAGGTGDSDD